jgi:hypothetical protein
VRSVLAALQELAAQPRTDGSPAAAVRLAEALTRMSERHVAVPQAVRGTTHVSVVDRDGALAAMTLSNGSCSGVFLPGTGVQLNNVLGEADLHPQGTRGLAAGTRIGSMMAPTLLRTPDGTRTALGSGGSERIRSALLCTLTALVDRTAPLADAVTAPRLHWDRHVLQVEPGLGPDVLAALRPGARGARVGPPRPVLRRCARRLPDGGRHADRRGRRPAGRRRAARRRRLSRPARRQASGAGGPSMPASSRCCAVMGVGAPVSGSPPPPVFGNAITSRMESEPVIMATMRSMPKAMPPCGGGP